MFSVCVWICFVQKMLLDVILIQHYFLLLKYPLKRLEFVSFNIFIISFIKHMPFSQQQGALQLTETLTKPHTALCQGEDSIKTLNLQLNFQHNQNTDVRAESSSLKLQKSLMKALLMDTPLEVEPPLLGAFKDMLGGLTSDLLAPMLNPQIKNFLAVSKTRI